MAALNTLLMLVPLLMAQEGPAALDQFNASFRQAYARAKADALARMGPVLVVDGDRVHLLRGGVDGAEALIRPPLYHRLKAVAHVPFTVQLLLGTQAEGPLPEDTRTRLGECRRLAVAVRASLGDSFEPGPTLRRQERILDGCLAYVDQVLGRGRHAARELAAFTQAMTPLLRINIAEAAGLQLTRLHQTVAGWRAELGPAAWRELRVVIIGPHMPRDGEVTWQYFARLLAEPKEGDRVIYAEGLWKVKDALDLLATHQVDRAAAVAFFQEPQRMHRDLLADAAEAWLDDHPGWFR